MLWDLMYVHMLHLFLWGTGYVVCSFKIFRLLESDDTWAASTIGLMELCRRSGQPAFFVFLIMVPVVNVVVIYRINKWLVGQLGSGERYIWGMTFVGVIFYPLFLKKIGIKRG